MPKNVPSAFIRQCAIRKSPPLPESEITRLALTSIPESVEKWIEATDVSGRIYGTKSRGPRLKDVDRQYRAWVSGDLTNTQNAGALYDALDKYRGNLYKLEGSAAGIISRDYRDARDKGGIMSTVYDLTRLISTHGSDVTAAVQRAAETEQERRRIRRRVITMMGNIKLDWDWKSDLLGGLSFAGDLSEEIGLTAAIKKSTDAQIVLGTTLPTIGAAVVIGTGEDKAQFENSVSGSLKKYATRFWNFLKDLFKKFVDAAAKKIAEILSLNVMEIIGTLSKIMKVIFKFVLEEAVPFLEAGMDVIEGAKTLIEDAITRTNITEQSRQLGSALGEYSLLRAGIVDGIARRQAVAGYQLAKGAGSIVAAVFGADKIVGLVLGGFEFGFKLVWNIVENQRIQGFLAQSQNMFRKVHANYTPHHEGIDYHRALMSMEEIEALAKAPRPVGTMPDFKSEHYTHAEFLNDRRGAYLNFIYSACKTSPLLACVVMNSGVVKDVDSVLHVASWRSTTDEQTARDQINLLRKEARTLFEASSFKVLPAKITDFEGEPLAKFEEMVRYASLTEALPTVTA